MTNRPLVLDVDGTLLRTDMLLECFWAGLGKDPLATLKASARNLGNRAKLKAELAAIAGIRTDLLPVNEHVLEIAHVAQERGREVVLASASDKSLVAPLAEHLGFSDRIVASDGETNMKGAEKAAALVSAFGESDFDYAGLGPCAGRAGQRGGASARWLAFERYRQSPAPASMGEKHSAFRPASGRACVCARAMGDYAAGGAGIFTGGQLDLCGQ
ncbi:MAG: haloacid dehalogenase-like hydrolase [Maritimibacter sp.]